MIGLRQSCLKGEAARLVPQLGPHRPFLAWENRLV